MARLYIDLLDTFQATLDGELITAFESNKARALLAYLVLENDHPQQRAFLASLLWPDTSERKARANLRHALANLRMVLGDRDADRPFLAVDQQTIQFINTNDCQIDVKVFTEYISMASVHDHVDQEKCNDCALLLSEAERRYRGEFLKGFSVPSIYYEEWVVVQREKLHIQLLDTLDHLATYYESKGDLQTARQYAHRQVELEPWCESAHRQMMRTFALNGQRGMALAQYQSCRQILITELGIEPEVETAVLFEEILKGDLQPTETPAKIQTTTQRKESLVIPHNLPTMLTPFIERPNLQSEIDVRLEDPQSRLVTLFGSGGSGKTRLAQETAYRLMKKTHPDMFSDGFFFIPLVSVRTTDDIVLTIAQTVGLTYYGENEPEQQLLSYLKRKKMLLILDNFEHLVGDSNFIVQILRKSPGVKILVTSRVKLNLPSEQVVPVSGMAYPASASEFSSVAQYGAVQLFIQSARRVKPDFLLDADNATQVVHICQLVQGMPLGILIATAWLHMLTPVEIAVEIERSLDFLDVEWQEVPARQRSMRAVFNHSWRLLNDREKNLLCGLSVFREGCTREAVHAVIGASLRDLLGLINKSQLHRTPGGRYEMHELSRQYASEQLANNPETETVAKERHCRYFAVNLERWAGALKGPQQYRAIVEIAPDIENLKTAIEYMLEKSKITWLTNAIVALALFFELVNRYQEGATQCQTIAQRAKAYTNEKGKKLRAYALGWQAYLTEQAGDIKTAQRIITAGLSVLGISEVMDGEYSEFMIPESETEKRLYAFIFWAASYTLMATDLEKARWFAEQSLSLHRLLKDRWSIARSLYALGAVFGLTGLNTELESIYREILAITQSIGDYHGIIEAYQSIGEVLLQITGQFEEGRQAYQMAQTTAYESGIALSVYSQFNMPLANYHLGNFTQAHDEIEAVISRYEEEVVNQRLVEGRISLARYKRHLGRYEAASTLLYLCIKQCEDADYIHRRAQCYVELGSLAIARGHYNEAQLMWAEMERLFQNMGSRFSVGPISRALIARGMGSIKEAGNLLLYSLKHVVSQGIAVYAMRVLPFIALLMCDLDQIERAVELYAYALQNPFVANSKWYDDITGRHIRKASCSLPYDVVVAAQARGCDLDLWKTVHAILAEFGEDHMVTADIS